MILELLNFCIERFKIYLRSEKWSLQEIDKKETNRYVAKKKRIDTKLILV